MQQCIFLAGIVATAPTLESSKNIPPLLFPTDPSSTFRNETALIILQKSQEKRQPDLVSVN